MFVCVCVQSTKEVKMRRVGWIGMSWRKRPSRVGVACGCGLSAIVLCHVDCVDCYHNCVD